MVSPRGAYLYRDTRDAHPRTTDQTALRAVIATLADVALNPALTSHDCIQMPEFFPRVRSLFQRAASDSKEREREHIAARFLVPFFVADGNDGSNGTARGNNRS